MRTRHNLRIQRISKQTAKRSWRVQTLCGNPTKLALRATGSLGWVSRGHSGHLSTQSFLAGSSASGWASTQTCEMKKFSLLTCHGFLRSASRCVGTCLPPKKRVCCAIIVEKSNAPAMLALAPLPQPGDFTVRLEALVSIAKIDELVTRTSMSVSTWPSVRWSAATASTRH